ncbi:MAG: proline--tRNA ligase, partial [Candidatus Thermoplasmatota archaeon]|nr:proline--tRNA ligase [Candidatus Thermoplasmatota archaeon]
NISQDEIVQTVDIALDEISHRLLDRAKTLLDEKTHIFTSLDEAKNHDGIIQLPWCGTDSCALEVEEILDGNTLGEPIKKDEHIGTHKCVLCDNPATTWMRFAKTY